MELARKEKAGKREARAAVGSGAEEDARQWVMINTGAKPRGKRSYYGSRGQLGEEITQRRHAAYDRRAMERGFEDRSASAATVLCSDSSDKQGGAQSSGG